MYIIVRFAEAGNDRTAYGFRFLFRRLRNDLRLFIHAHDTYAHRLELGLRYIFVTVVPKPAIYPPLQLFIAARMIKNAMFGSKFQVSYLLRSLQVLRTADSDIETRK